MVELSNEQRQALLSDGRSERILAERVWQNLTQSTQLDLLEVCAPWDAPLPAAVRDEGGRARSISIHNGYDLSTNQGFQKAANLIRTLRPRYLHVPPPCGPWRVVRNLVSPKHRSEENLAKLGRERLLSRRLLKNCKRLCEIQRRELNQGAGGSVHEDELHHGGGEQPLCAQSWKLPEFRSMVKMCGGEKFRVDGCMHGMRIGSGHHSVRKPWGWFFSLQGVRKALERKCVHGSAAHETLRGHWAAASAAYPY